MIMKKIMLLVVGIMISTCVMGQTSTMEKYYAIKQMSDSLETLVDSYCIMVMDEPYDNIVMVDSLEKEISKVHLSLKRTKAVMYEMNEAKEHYYQVKKSMCHIKRNVLDGIQHKVNVAIEKLKKKTYK